jgi:hypothetical protein
MELALQAGNAGGLQMHEDRKRGSRRECTKPGGVKTGNVHGPEPRMRRHLRRWLTQHACKRAPPSLRLRPVRPVPPARDAIPGPRPDRPFRPVRPALSLAPATRRSVACDRRAPVLMRHRRRNVHRGNQHAPAATTNPPSPRHAAPHAHHPSQGGVLLRTALAGRQRLWDA